MKSYLNNQAPPFTFSPSMNDDEEVVEDDEPQVVNNSRFLNNHQSISPQHTKSQVQSPTFGFYHSPPDSNSLGVSLDGCRSWSAPPGQASFYLPFPIDEENDDSNINESGSRLHRLQSRLRQMELKENKDDVDQLENDPIMHPGYGAYFHNSHRLDHRLPPPPYSPGTSSWQHMWPPSQGQKTNITFQSQQPPPPLKPVSLVDRIQADFPRTPSPVYGLQQYPQQPVTGILTTTSSPQSPSSPTTSSSLSNPPFKPKSPPLPITTLEVENIDKIPETKISFSAAATAPKLSPSIEKINQLATSIKDKKSKSKKTKEHLLQHLTTLEDLSGQMFTASTDQHGSRFIQQQLEFSSNEMKTSILMELLPHLASLVTDVFGNYVVQKIFEHGSEEQKILLAKSLQNDILRLSLQMYGCRVVQKALEHLPMDWKLLLISELKGNVLRCVRDQNGNHVIQKCIECCCKMGPSSTIPSFLLDSFKDQISILAKHPYGCRVIQRIFEQENKVDPSTSKMIRSLIDEMHLSIKDLIEDQYGNYVVQHLLSIDSKEDCSKIIKDCISGNLLYYSKHKFASNVVEKCVAHGPKIDRMILIDESLQELDSNSIDVTTSLLDEWPSTTVPIFVLMMKDQFANYVLQKMLDVIDGDQRIHLLKDVRYNLGILKKLAFGKHCLVKLERMLQNY